MRYPRCLETQKRLKTVRKMSDYFNIKGDSNEFLIYREILIFSFLGKVYDSGLKKTQKILKAK